MRAFSLVELSIVLVILGLLTGGILAGQSLIRASELRSVSTQMLQFQTAAQSFRDKYFAIPGDMNNATTFWGSAGGDGLTSGTCAAQTGTGTQTCNGNADGALSYPAAASRYGESLTFWQHLASAGLIEGSYTGKSGSGGAYHYITGTNTAAGKISNSGWFAFTAYGISGSSVASDGDYGNYFFIGANNANTLPTNPLLTPEESWNIDTKLDDGKPQRGMIWAYYWDTCTDAATSADHAGSYLLSVRSVECGLYFRNAF